jgi:hypothetical protein
MYFYSFFKLRSTNIIVPSVTYEVQTRSLIPPFNIVCSVSRYLYHLFSGFSRKAILRCMNFLVYCAWPTSRPASCPALPRTLSPYNLLAASRTPVDSRVETNQTCAAAPTRRLPSELKVKRLTLS